MTNTDHAVSPLDYVQYPTDHANYKSREFKFCERCGVMFVRDLYSAQTDCKDCDEQT